MSNDVFFFLISVRFQNKTETRKNLEILLKVKKNH